MAAGAARGRDTRLCRAERDKARLDRSAVARGADRLARLTGDFRRDAGLGAGGEPRTDRRRGTIGGLMSRVCQAPATGLFCTAPGNRQQA